MNNFLNKILYIEINYLQKLVYLLEVILQNKSNILQQFNFSENWPTRKFSLFKNGRFERKTKIALHK